MKIRVITAVVLAAAVSLGTAGCNLIQPQATTKHYDPSDGVGVNLGSLDIRNMMILTDNGGETANLMLGAVNTTNGPITLNIWFEVDGVRQTVAPVVIPSSQQVVGFGNKGQPQIVLQNINVEPGGILTLTLQAGDSDTKVVPVPVLNTELPEYNGLTPSPMPTVVETATPTPTASPVG